MDSHTHLNVLAVTKKDSIEEHGKVTPEKQETLKTSIMDLISFFIVTVVILLFSCLSL